MINWQEYLVQSDYNQIASLCKMAIHIEPSLGINYYYLGLASLLQEREEEAKETWNLGLKNSSHADLYTEELYEILRHESSRQENLKEYQTALTIRQHIRQILPTNFDNLVQISYLYLNLQTFTLGTLQELNLINLIQSEVAINDNSLLQLIQNVAYSPISTEESLEFVSSCLPYVKNKDDCVDMLLYLAINTSLEIALKLINMCKELCPNSIKVLGCLVQVYTRHDEGEYSKAIEVARNVVQIFSQYPLDRLVANHLLLGALMNSGGNWQEVETIFDQQKSLLTQIIEKNPIGIPTHHLGYISLICFFTPYIQDIPQSNHILQNQALSLFQSNIQHASSKLVQNFQTHHLVRKQKTKKQKLRIGYLATSLRRHSVGWLARSLFQHFDRDAFEVYGYFPEYKLGKDFLEEWYIGRMHKVYKGGVDYWGDHFLVAEQIDRDEIDILVDIESMTSATCCSILALKPAPLQVTWLGWDASGLPAIDYYIADPYVLPENAQEYYSEKIWRLPQTYLAVDGFETSIASLHRSDLDIPADAIIYFSAQKSYKRHPDTVRSQIQIIRQVPNSYFLIKGLADESSIQNFFYEIADSEGVERDRLKFLPFTSSEAEHRANMAIADVVLDTYPYNGATTTMETLWMGIPMVTQVGEQFVARNSYTMMMNAGITEGIAWNVEEYVEWGVKFGTDPHLRKEVAWKLNQSRKTSPLWDGRQFAREMENAYRQMWRTYNE
jgi:predicted O-linked N-acetylglucosamine transferase (SPINDLY family)